MIKKRTASFKNAIAGLIWVVKTQINFKIHLLLSILAVVASIIIQISYEEFLVILVLIGVGLVIETINTAIEETIDALHKERSEEIKIAKDVSAAAMLIFSAISLIIALFIFIPKLLNL